MVKTVYVLDDHDIVRVGLEMLVGQCPQLQLVGSAARLADALTGIAALQPDLVISDMSVDDSKGLDTVRAVVAAQQGRGVLIVSMHDELLYGEQVLALGARGYLMKESAHAHVVGAALDVVDGRTWVSARLNERLLARLRPRTERFSDLSQGESALTQRELEVLERLGHGKTTKEIAFDLELSVRTVDIYRASLKRKLGLRTAAELIAYSLART